MKILILFLLLFRFVLCETEVWVNADRDPGDDVMEFNNHVLNEGGIKIADYYLSLYAKKHVDQGLLLEKIDFFSKQKFSVAAIDSQIHDLQQNYILNSSNRLLLFEYLKLEAASSKSLCRIYANDLSLKTAEPFFEASCGLNRIALASIHPNLTKFDYALIDGNKIDIQTAPYFFSSGQPHQFVFISNQYQTQELTATVSKLKTQIFTLAPWIEGHCDEKLKSNVALSEPVKVYFSKDCIRYAKDSGSPTLNFIRRNKYYIISGLLIAVAALYTSSQYELGVGLP